jgi:hypothetical protein
MSGELELRLQRHEDEAAIAEVLALYGWYADSGDHDGFVDLFSDDAVIELIGGVPSGAKGDPAIWTGQAEIRSFIDDPDMHMKIEGRCMHLPALNLRTTVDGDAATAESCSVVLLRDNSGTSVYGAGFTRWMLIRSDGRWLIKRRTRVAIGEAHRMVAWA